MIVIGFLWIKSNEKYKKLSIALVLFALVFSLNVVMAAKKSNNEKCFSSKTFLVESRDTK